MKKSGKTELVRCGGNIVFNPKDYTNKHIKQSGWRKTAIVDIDGQWTEYYSWFLKKRGLILNAPLRKAHITFINESVDTIKAKNRSAKQQLWTNVANMFNGKYIEFDLEVQQYSSGKHWWLRIPKESEVNMEGFKGRGELNGIRQILYGTIKGEFEYKWGFHMTTGLANEKNIIQSQYLRHLDQFGFADKRTQELAFQVLGLPPLEWYKNDAR